MDAPELLIVAAIALAVVAFILWPVLGRARPDDGPAGAASAVDLDRLERRIGEYRDALRRRTVCERCLFANPDASRFCAQCGVRLGAADAQRDAILDPS